MYYEWAIVLFSIFHIQQAVLDKTYKDQPTCERARVALGYAQISPFGVHGECQMVAVPAPLAPLPPK